MGVAEFGTERTATTVDGPGLIRAGILLVFGILITFTPQLHTIGFAAVVFGVFGVLWAVAILTLWALSPAERRLPGSRLLALLGAVAGVLALSGAVTQVQLLSLVIGIWAVLSAATIFFASRTAAASRGRDATLQAAMLALLGVLTLFVPGDAIGVIGFFGGYCMLAGVFLAIASFDRATQPTSSRGSSS